MSGMRIEILEKELSRLKKKDPERFRKIIDGVLGEEVIEKKTAQKVIKPTYTIFERPEIARSIIFDMPDNPALIEQAYYGTLEKLSTQNEKTFLDLKIIVSENENAQVISVNKDHFEVLKKLYYIENIDTSDSIELNFRIQRDQGTILSPSPFVKGRKIAFDILKNKESKFRKYLRAIENPVTKNEFKKESKKLLVKIIKTKLSEINPEELITIIAVNIRNISRRFYEELEFGKPNVSLSDLLFIFSLYEGINYLQEKVPMFSPMKGSYEINKLFEWSSIQQIHFTIWMVSFLIAIKLYNIATEEIEGNE